MAGIPESVILDGNEEAYLRGMARRIAANAMKTTNRRMDADPAFRALINYVHTRADAERNPGFFTSLQKGLTERGKLSEKQELAVAKIMREEESKRAEMRARDAGSQFFGSVKERLTLKLTINGYKHTAYDDFDGTPENHFHAMKDDAGNVFIYSGSVKLGEKDAVVNIRATIKSHYEKHGVKTNYLARPKAL